RMPAPRPRDPEPPSPALRRVGARRNTARRGRGLTSARERELALAPQERARAQLEPTDIRQPHRQTKWSQETFDEIVSGEAIGEKAREIVEERMRHGVEADQAAG